MIKKILKFSLRYPYAILLMTLLISLYGLYCFKRLPIDAVPDITNNQVQINTELPGLSPLQVEKQITYHIETALAGIPGLQKTRSLSRNGFSQVTAIFDDSLNIYFARQQINERLSQVKESLPPGAEVHMGPISTGLGEIFMWTVDFKHPDGLGAPLHKDLPGWQPGGIYLTPEGNDLTNDIEKASYLRMVQDWIIKPQLKGIQGLADIDSIGGYVLQYHVEPDLEQMIALGLNFEQIIQALEKNNLSVGPGYIEKNGEALLVKSDERLESSQEIKTILLTAKDGIPVRIGDIANVTIGKEMRTGSASHNGQESVVGTALMLIGANSRTVAQSVEAKLSEINQTLPADIVATPVINRTKLVNATLHTISRNLSEGALLVIAILFAFLGHFRAALITALVIPLSMLMTTIGMVHAQMSGNLMSLGAIDFGLIVDGAVIITENCLRRLAQKQQALQRILNLKERLKIVMSSSKEMIQPTVFGQAIIIIVYFPILALAGVEGKMFHPMALTVIFALISAFILSLTFIPAMIALFVKGSIEEKENFLVRKSKEIYLPLLKKSLKTPWKSVLAASLAVLLSLILFFQLGEEFIPTLDEKDLAMHAMRIPSTSLTQSTEMQKEIETTLLQLPEVAYVFSKTGTAEMASDPMPPNVSDTFIILKPAEEWPQPSLKKEELIKKMESSLSKLLGNNYEFTQPIEMRFNELISGVRSDLAINIYGDDFKVMQKTAEEIARLLKTLPGAADVKIAQTNGLPILDIKMDREASSRLGLNVSDALKVISIAMGGGKAGQIFEGDRRFDIIVKLSDSLRDNLENLRQLPIPLPFREAVNNHYSYIPLNEVATFNINEGLNEIKRENGKRFIAVQANVRGVDLGSFVENAKKQIATTIKVPEGCGIL